MLRGTRIITGDEARIHSKVINIFREYLIDNDYEEIIIPSIWNQQTFIDKTGPEIISQMWTFDDKAGRPCCLIPEVTGLVQEMWRGDWSKRTDTRRVFYVNRCYRYERPQAGRYREFTQFGIELLGKSKDARLEVVSLLLDCLDRVDVKYVFNDLVVRGISYYVEQGFEAVCEQLGAQKQIAGGGTYSEGVGWAIGIDRLVLALKK